MSEYCEVVEALANAVSSCPATDVIMVQGVVAQGSSSVVIGIQPGITTGSANATSQVTTDAYALAVNSANVSSTLLADLHVSYLLTGTANAKSSTKFFLENSVVAATNAQSSIPFMDVPQLLISSAIAESSVDMEIHASMSAVASAKGSSWVSFGLLELVMGSANAASSAMPLRVVSESVQASAQAGSVATITSSAIGSYLLVGQANAASTVFFNSEINVFLESVAEATSDVWYKDPGRVAWVLNTETTAVSWYNNFDFESIIQHPSKVLAVGPDGLYELTGDTDSGEEVDAQLVSGFTDFETERTKHVDAMYFGYTSDGTLSLTAETYDSGHAPVTYVLEQRDADAPRNTRVLVGKGMWGRYWRMTMKNVQGANFEINAATVDIAVSTRRV